MSTADTTEALVWGFVIVPAVLGVVSLILFGISEAFRSLTR